MPSLDQKLFFKGQPHSTAQIQVKRPIAKSTLASWLPTTKSALLAVGTLTGLGVLYVNYKPRTIPPNPDLTLSNVTPTSSNSVGALIGTIFGVSAVGLSIFYCVWKKTFAAPDHTELPKISSPIKQGSTKGENPVPSTFVEIFDKRDEEGKILTSDPQKLFDLISIEGNEENKEIDGFINNATDEDLLSFFKQCIDGPSRSLSDKIINLFPLKRKNTKNITIKFFDYLLISKHDKCLEFLYKFESNSLQCELMEIFSKRSSKQGAKVEYSSLDLPDEPNSSIKKLCCF